MGMSVNSFLSVSGAVYNIEESALCRTTRPASSFISQVSSTTNMLIGVLFDYDNDDLGTLRRTIRTPIRPRASCSSTAT